MGGEEAEGVRCEWDEGLWDWAWDGWVGVAILGGQVGGMVMIKEGAELADWWTDCSQGWGGLRTRLGIADEAVALGGARRSGYLRRVFE